MNLAIEISKIVDEYLPADGINTPREIERIGLYNDILKLLLKHNFVLKIKTDE